MSIQVLRGTWIVSLHNINVYTSEISLHSRSFWEEKDDLCYIEKKQMIIQTLYQQVLHGYFSATEKGHFCDGSINALKHF